MRTDFPLKKERKAAKTLGLIIGVFLFCRLPFFCVNVVHPLKGCSDSPLILEACSWLGYANSSLNPFLLFQQTLSTLIVMETCEAIGNRTQRYEESRNFDGKR
ncbi:hypothetical protein CesoFtcFv8_010271 [Champsocephalus esox]|uniref:G-protein coupled receptors family 1 profile domain-containing protein n=1 Tax=Champsocephalus esox TaxID=159716 RepID=A0AAN8C5B7_9TELE|nr:hypothetical protein CesoFtcFv8_010271 [Champsocephalus esox]